MFSWLDNKDKDFKNIFINAVKFQDDELYDSSLESIFDAISMKPSTQNIDKLSQYFTPVDVALYTAYNLLKDKKQLDANSVVFDPSLGKGSLLISIGIVLALKYGYRDKELLSKLHGCEICKDTLDDAIQNILIGLKDYTTNLTHNNAKSILSKNLINQDFLSFEFVKDINYLVITNPPYKENKQHNIKNIWIAFIEKILDSSNVKDIGAIVPVSISCADRTKSIRQKILTNFNNILAFHHEIRPRPLFKGVEQRISILILKNNSENGKNMYKTTGFLTHKSKERMSIWTASYSNIPIKYCQNVFPKPFNDEISFMKAVVDNQQKIADITDGELTEFWIRTSGRYHLVSQKDAPNEITSKWSKKQAPSKQYEYINEQFNNGNALTWWRIFGDGRDFSINKFTNNFGCI